MLGLYLPLQASGSFADPDSFYHMKMAELIAARGPILDFVWLPFTTLARSYADHHFLYHVLLIPFIKVFGTLQGMKIATAVFAAAAIAAIAWALRKLGIKYAVLFALAAGIMNPLAFRIGLSKASALGVLLLIVGLTMAVLRRHWALGIVAFIYVWTHGGWPALLGLGTAAIMMMSLRAPARAAERVSIIKRAFRWIRAFVSANRNNGAGKPLAALWLGTALGVVVNPFFPDNLRFYWEQTVQIAVVGYKNVIGVGAEWYGYAPKEIISQLPLLGLMVLAALACFVAVFVSVRQNPEGGRMRIAAFWAAAALAFLAMTVRSRRHIEYFVPLAVMAVAAWIDLAPVKAPKETRRRYAVSLTLLACGLFSMVLIFGRNDLAQAKNDLASGYKFTLYRQAAAYLRDHARPGEVIVHSDWDDFPLLFYWNDQNRYMMGLDPTFLYSASHDVYWEYVDFTLGKSADPVKVMNDLDARYVFSDRYHQELENMLKRTGRFEQVYIDPEAVIYILK